MGSPELVLDARAELGEGPVWDARARVLIWVDIPAGLVHRFDPLTARDEVLEVGRPVGAAVPTTTGRLLLAVADGFRFLDPSTGVTEHVADIEADDPRTMMNDGGCDPGGRLWAGTKDVEGDRSIGSLYRIGSDLETTRVLSGVTISNGLAWSPDGSTMYYIDSPTHGVDAFDVDPRTGAATGRRRLATFPEAWGLPDGMAIDEEGLLWVAFWGGGTVRRIGLDGRVADEVPVPARLTTSCAFGGDDLADLYVTSARVGLSESVLRDEPGAGGLFRLRPGIRGASVPAFLEGDTGAVDPAAGGRSTAR